MAPTEGLEPERNFFIPSSDTEKSEDVNESQPIKAKEADQILDVIGSKTLIQILISQKY